MEAGAEQGGEQEVGLVDEQRPARAEQGVAAGGVGVDQRRDADEQDRGQGCGRDDEQVADQRDLEVPAGLALDQQEGVRLRGRDGLDELAVRRVELAQGGRGLVGVRAGRGHGLDHADGQARRGHAAPEVAAQHGLALAPDPVVDLEVLEVLGRVLRRHGHSAEAR
ncbi:hypothetical protein [Plesiocystis pacifica]|uniref:hypothetical protein n=1 Tax=Plesiocystis pacifica TaxID=191768 RepID=UPI0012FC1C9D|nr:hypothetical protein [Plesiocystis pacifica]